MSIPLSVIKTRIGEKAQENSSNVLNKLVSYINRFYEQLWNNFNWKEITVIDEPLVLVSGEVVQVLPRYCAQIITITSRAIGAILQPSSPFVYQQKYLGDLASSSSPLAYTEAGRSAIKTNLSTADTISLVSDSISDVHIGS